MFLNKHRKVN